MSEDIIDNRNILLVDFLNSLLPQSNQVRIASGYFRITGWNLIKESFDNVEKMKLVMGIHTDKPTADSLDKGYQMKHDSLKAQILKDVYSDLEKIEEGSKKKILELYDLIENGKIDVKIFCKKFFHSKVYLFNTTPFTSIVGSSNFTSRGLTDNVELNAVLRSKSAYDFLVDWFEQIWEDSEVFNRALLDTRAKIHKTSPKEPKDRDNDEPQSEGEVEPPDIDTEEELVDSPIGDQDPFTNIAWKVPQSIGYQNWLNNNKKGILQIATGVGKTLIAIRAIYDFINLHSDNKKKIFILIGVHSNPMINQWREEIFHWLGNSKMGKLRTISGQNNSSIDSQIDELKLDVELYNTLIVIAHYNTICSKLVPYFNNLNINQAVFFVADEVHELGTENRINKIKNFQPISCMGLSATPARYFDKKGTDFLTQFFNRIVYKYNIEQAINDEYLCRYYYKPVICELSSEEFKNYEKKTKALAIEQQKKPKDKEKIRQIATDRARIVKKAKDKDNKVIELIHQIRTNLKEDNKRLEHMLVYFEDNLQLLETYGKLSLNIIKQRITQEYPIDLNERAEIIRELKIGTTQLVFAIQILDQGINIPELEYAIIVASTWNQKQFIQRRGRILRHTDNKEFAVIYDLVIPKIEKELERVKIFYDACSNKNEVKNLLNELDIDIESIKLIFKRSEEG